MWAGERKHYSEREGNQTGAADPRTQYPGQHSSTADPPEEPRTDTLTLFFTLRLNEHVMHRVSSTATQTGGIAAFLRRFQSDADKVQVNAIADPSFSH